MAKPTDGSDGCGNSLSYKAILFMFLLAVQFGIQPIATKRFTSKAIIKGTVIFMQEVVKLIVGAVGISLGKASWGDVAAGWTFMSWCRLALLPATIYLVQNTCSLLAYQNLDPITYNVLNQTKTLSAALCCYLIMSKKQSTVQVFSLLLLLAAALVMEGVVPLDGSIFQPSHWMSKINSGDAEAEEDSATSLYSRHFSHGVLPILVASFLSGLAGAITQKSLQVGNRNALLFTIELCVASLLILLGSFITSDDGAQIRQRGFFSEWDAFTAIPILFQSVGGILVGLVIKYAGTVRKGFALIFGILLSGIVQSALDEDKSLSKEEVAGGALAALSLWMHATNPYVQRQSAEETMRGMKKGASATMTKKTAFSGTSKVGRGRKSRKED